MAAATLQPPAGAAGELTGLLLMRAYHESRGETRHKVIIPDSAHGTNPASVTLGGYQTVTVPSDRRGLVDLDALRARLDPDVAGIMLTNPNTLGLFEEDIAEIAAAVHEVGGLLYYDGANLNAILGVTRPGDMGFDIVHMNLHKTFAVPHGGGGPGPGRSRSPPAWRTSSPARSRSAARTAASPGRRPPRSIGRVHTWHGNALALARAWAYILANGGDGLRRVAEGAVLNANWLRHQLRGRLRPALRPAQHARVRGLHHQPQEGQGRAGPRRRQTPAGRGLPRPDGVLPADRRRGPHDRADRDREPPDRRRPGRGPGHDRRRPGGSAGPGARAPRRSGGSTRPGRPGPCLPTWDAVVAAARLDPAARPAATIPSRRGA